MNWAIAADLFDHPVRKKQLFCFVLTSDANLLKLMAKEARAGSASEALE